MFLFAKLLGFAATAFGKSGLTFCHLVLWDEPECPKELIK